MNWTIAAYVVYLAVTVPITVWVATELYRNGKVFLADVFGGDDGLATAVNKLLVVGFYLLNLGFVMVYLRTGGDIADAVGLFRSVSLKVGVVMLILGVLHILNVWVFNRLRRRHRIEMMYRQAPPMPPMQPMQPMPAYPGPRR